MKTILALMLIGAAWGQVAEPDKMAAIPRYYAYQSATNTAMKITIQGNGTNDTFWGESVVVKCSVGSTITFSKNGTAATATALPLIQPPGSPQGSPWAAFSASDVGAGTTGVVDVFTDAFYVVYDISDFFIRSQAPTNANFTVSSSATTGTCYIKIKGRTRFN